jgi:RHS repeat-associated protein
VIPRTYDSLYRLTGAQYSTGESFAYTYDAVGNRLSLVTSSGSTSYEYDAANRLTSVNGVVYTWDANGNLLNDGVSTYTYDHADRLTQVANGTLTTEFAYNGVGDRVAKTVDGVTTDYVLDPAAGLTQVLQETTNGQTTGYLYGADLLAQYDSGTWAYHVNDGLGSVRHLADPVGQVVQSYSFSPFGVPLEESGGEPHGYTGEQWDAEVGMLYLRTRYYDAQTGRFLTPDSFPGFATRPQTFNAYPYSTNNPATLVDPSGHQGGEAGVLEWSFECLLSNPACQAAAAEGVAIVAVTVEIVGPVVLIAGAPLALMYLSTKYGYWPEPTVYPRPAPAPPGDPPTEEWGTPPAPPPLSPDGTRPMDMRPQPQPVPAPEPPPAPEPRSQPDPFYYPTEPCPRETETPEPKWHLYHYTTDAGLAGILATQVIKVTTDDPEGWGDGQYFTDITPQDASIGSAYQLSRALFTLPWYNKRVKNWVKVNVAGLSVKRVGPVFSRTYGNKSIYLHPSQSPLNVADRIDGWGPTPFSR